MARTSNKERSANRVAVDVGSTGSKQVPKGAVLVLVLSLVAALWALAMMTPTGRVGYVYFFEYADFYMGVLVLVSLSITIMIGLVSTDRLMLSIRQRVFLQSTHRTTGVMAVSSLVLHLWTNIAEGTLRWIDIFVPFLAPYNKLYIGMGTLSGYVLVLVTWSGLARARFIGRGKPWMWRAIHSVSYLMWPLAIVHGLSAGRAAKPWVTVSYIVCVLLVLVGLAVRLSVSLNRRKDFSSSAATGALTPVGKMVPTNGLAAKKRPSRREPERVEPETLGPVAVLDTFQPASPVLAGPIAEEPGRGRRPAEDEMPAPRQRRAAPDDRYDEERPRGRRRADDEIEFDEPTPPRGRRYAEDTGTRMRRPELETTSTRMRRAEMDDTSTRMRRAEMDDTSTRMRRAEMDDTSTRMRRAEMDDTRAFRPDFDDAPAPRQRRYADDDEPAPRSRRRADESRYDDTRGAWSAAGDYDDVPRQRASRYDDEPPRRSRSDSRYGRDEEDAPRARRDRGADNDRADLGRHSRSGFVDLVDDEDPNYLPPDETPTLIDMASRRARREQQEPVRVQAGRGARRAGRGRVDDEVADDRYWSQLRGEAN